jgi:hypothetical protein
MNETTNENKAHILADLWMNFRDDEQFSDFIEYNDLGLPLAYATSSKIIKPSERSDGFIAETFNLLLASMGVEDTGFETLDEILDYIAE